MRFEVGSAYVIGAILPVAETIRRWGRVDTVASFVDDFLIGAWLLAAAWAATRGKPWGHSLLVGAWGGLSAGLYYSIAGQLERDAPRDVSGLSTTVVILVKAMLLLVAIAALARAVRTGAKAAPHGKEHQVP